MQKLFVLFAFLLATVFTSTANAQSLDEAQMLRLDALAYKIVHERQALGRSLGQVYNRNFDADDIYAVQRAFADLNNMASQCTDTDCSRIGQTGNDGIDVIARGSMVLLMTLPLHFIQNSPAFSALIVSVVLTTWGSFEYLRHLGSQMDPSILPLAEDHLKRRIEHHSLELNEYNFINTDHAETVDHLLTDLSNAPGFNDRFRQQVSEVKNKVAKDKTYTRLGRLLQILKNDPDAQLQLVKNNDIFSRLSCMGAF